MRDDLTAGVTVAALAIPLGLAFAQLAGLPPVYGLYTSIVPVIVFALIASSPQAVVGAEAALAGIVAAAIAPSVLLGHDRVEAASALALMVGVACLLGAALRLGRIAQLVSRTVFIGYLAGVAVSVSVSQLPKLVGADHFRHDQLVGQLTELPGVLESSLTASSLLGASTLVLVVLGRRVAPRVPVALAALVISAALARLLRLDDAGVQLVGALPSSLPLPILPGLHVNDLLAMLPAAIAIAIVGFADTTLVSQGFAARNGYAVNSSRDLAALGAADLAAGAFGGLPVSASSARTAAAESSGAHSQLASIVSAAAVAFALIIGTELVGWIPQAALAGIIIAVMGSLIDLDAIRSLRRGRASELMVCTIAFLGVAMLGVLQGVAVAVAVSIAVVVMRAARPHDAFLGTCPEHRTLVPLAEHDTARPVPGFLIYRIDAPLFFGNSERVRERLVAAVSEPADDPIRHVIIAATAVTDIDYSAGQVLHEIASQLAAIGIDLTIAGIGAELEAELRSTLPPEHGISFESATASEYIAGTLARCATRPPTQR